MRKFILALAVLALAVPALAQQPTSRKADFAVRYDVASALKTYCVLGGRTGNPLESGTQVTTPVETAGLNITITAVTALSAPFTDVSVGDVLYFDIFGTLYPRAVVTKADNDTVTVDQPIDLSAGAGYQFLYREPVCGTTDSFGWVNVGGYPVVNLTVDYKAGDLGTLDVVFECRDSSTDGNIVQVYPGATSSCGFGALSGDVCQFSTPGTLPVSTLSFTVENNVFAACRVGLKWGTSDGAARESVNAFVSMWRY